MKKMEQFIMSEFQFQTLFLFLLGIYLASEKDVTHKRVLHNLGIVIDLVAPNQRNLEYRRP